MRDKVPWFVRRGLSPEQARLENSRRVHIPFFVLDKDEWEDVLGRRRTGQLQVNRRSNTTLRCPGCGQFLYRFYIPEDLRIQKRAEDDALLSRFISGYVCWHPCLRVYFAEDLKT